MRCWGCGGTGNNVAIQFEICEPKSYNDKEYFLAIKQTALELCVYLCKEFNISPADVTSHCEAYREYGATFASNHSDLDHWWKKYHNYTMDDFRMELTKMLKEEDVVIQELINKYGEEAVKNALEQLIKSVNDDGLPAKWAENELKEAIDLGITDGKNPEMFAKRQEVAIMVKRAISIEK